MTEDQPVEQIPEKKKEPGFMKKLSDYVKRNQEANRRAAERAASEPEDDSNSLVDEFLFGKPPKQKASQTAVSKPVSTPFEDENRIRLDSYNESQFIDKLCEFLRYIEEDDTVKLWRKYGSHFDVVDHKYLSKLLTRFYGHKITLKERDLLIR